MKITKAKLALAVTAVALPAGVAWHLATIKPAGHALLGLDSSISVEQKAPELRRSIEAFVDDKDGLREGSTLGVLIIGASARNPEPAPGFSGKIPYLSDSVYGRDEARFRAQRLAFFDEVQQTLENASPRRSSPIYALVTRGVEDLRSLGCGSPAPCYYLVKSDLIEDVEPALRAAIEAAAHAPDTEAPPELAGSIENSLIEVRFCGTSDMTPRGETGREEASPDARIRIWRELFSHPELVSFAPFCGR